MVRFSLIAVSMMVACDGEAASVPDAGATPEADAAPAFPSAGFGAISGACNVLDDEILSPEPFLAILAYAPEHADVIAEAWMGLDAATRGDTVVHLMVTNGADDFIYCDGACP